MPMGVKHFALELFKDYKRHKNGGKGAEKTKQNKTNKKKLERQEEETEKAGENTVTEDRLRCENVESVIYAGTYVNSTQVVRKGAIL